MYYSLIRSWALFVISVLILRTLVTLKMINIEIIQCKVAFNISRIHVYKKLLT